MLTLGVLASIAGVAIALAIDWFPQSASTQAKKVDSLWDIVLVISVPIFILVLVVVLFCVWKFRQRPGEELKDGPPIHGNTQLEVVWTAIPALLLVGLCSYTFFVLDEIEQKDPDELVVNVTGEQFTWTFAYPSVRAGGKPLASSQLYLPKDRPIRFNVRTKDVLHDFWVPQFRMKIDAVPGITTQVRVTPDTVGRYPVVCAELCGVGHATMRQVAHVVEPGEFQRWVRSRQRPAGGAAAGGGGGQAAADGRAIFTGAAGCGGCHTLAAAGTSGQTGPKLDQVLKGEDKAFIRESIVNPGAKIAKGFGPNIMPENFGQTLTPQELNALVDYLSKETQG